MLRWIKSEEIKYLSRCELVNLMRTSPWVIAALSSHVDPATGRPPKYPLTTRGILPARGLPKAVLRRYRLPPLQKADVKAGKGLMSPSAGVHCECSREEARIALCITLPLQRDLRTQLRRPKLGQSYINDTVVSCTPGHLYGCSLVRQRSAPW